MPGQLAVLLYRVLPDTNLQLSMEGLSTLRDEIAGENMLLAVGPLVVYALLMAVAWRADRSCFYLALRPRWMRLWPQRKSLLFFALLRHTVCVYHSLLRVVHVAPCFTNYTHAQLLHSLVLSATLTLLGVSLFLGTDQASTPE